MNRKVLSSIIGLLWVFLFGFFVLKLFFGEEFVAAVSNERIIQVGIFIDQYTVLYVMARTISSLALAHFYFCSCKQQWRLNRKEYLFILVYVLSVNVGYLWLKIVPMIIDLVGLIVIPILLRCKFKQTCAVFLLHQVGQLFVLFIRSEPLALADSNFLTTSLLLLDVYIWLIIYYFYSNLYKEKTLWELLLSPFSEICLKRSLKKSSRK